jgi:hypothetical protein
VPGVEEMFAEILSSIPPQVGGPGGMPGMPPGGGAGGMPPIPRSVPGMDGAAGLGGQAAAMGAGALAAAVA